MNIPRHETTDINKYKQLIYALLGVHLQRMDFKRGVSFIMLRNENSLMLKMKSIKDWSLKPARYLTPSLISFSFIYLEKEGRG